MKRKMSSVHWSIRVPEGLHQNIVALATAKLYGKNIRETVISLLDVFFMEHPTSLPLAKKLINEKHGAISLTKLSHILETPDEEFTENLTEVHKRKIKSKS